MYNAHLEISLSKKLHEQYARKPLFGALLSEGSGWMVGRSVLRKAVSGTGKLEVGYPGGVFIRQLDICIIT